MLVNWLYSIQFDTTKTRLQTAPRGFYTGLYDCLKKTAKLEGIRGFYAGMGSPLMGQMFFRAASFSTFYYVIKLLSDNDISSRFSLPGYSNGVARVIYVPNSSSEAPSSSSVQQLSSSNSDSPERLSAAHYLFAGAVTGLAISFIEVIVVTAHGR
jgi:Mitochondrial carrier protein